MTLHQVWQITCDGPRCHNAKHPLGGGPRDVEARAAKRRWSSLPDGTHLCPGCARAAGLPLPPVPGRPSPSQETAAPGPDAQLDAQREADREAAAARFRAAYIAPLGGAL